MKKFIIPKGTHGFIMSRRNRNGKQYPSKLTKPNAEEMLPEILSL